MTLQEQNEHANALMAIAATRHIQFAKQLITLAQQHLQIATDTSPQASRRCAELRDINTAMLHVSYNLDVLATQA